jgi:hypothetical protein
VSAWQAAGRLRFPGRLLVLGIVGLAGTSLVLDSGRRVELARSPLMVHTSGGELAPAYPSERTHPGTGLLDPRVWAPPAEVSRAELVRRRHRGLAYAWLRAHRDSLGADAVLWRSLGVRGDRSRGDLGLHLAPLYCGLPLWCDTAQASAGGSPRWEPRRKRMRELFELPAAPDPHSLRELERLGRPAVFLVEEFDREATHPRGKWLPFRGVDIDLARLGAERVHVVGTVAIYLWTPGTDQTP